jgi:predicted N-acetyltransferase YhbS
MRPMGEHDIPAVLAIQAESYAEQLLESAEIIRQRLLACPELAWVAEDARGVCAYLFGYRSRTGKVTPLDGAFTEPEAADCLYLHDLAVSRRAAGRGIGPALVQRLLEQGRASHLRYSALVSVQDSEPFWSRLGYSAAAELERSQQRNLASYGVPAVYMVRSLH